MTDFQINDRILQTECDELAQDIVDDFKRENPGKDLEDYRDEMMDRAHETADGHEWVIYTYKALMLCAHCDTRQGEEFLEDVGMPEDPTFDGLATLIAYGEMRSRIEEAISDIMDEYEFEEEEEEEEAAE